MLLDKLWKTNDKKIKREIKETKFEDIKLKEYIIIDVRGKREYNEGHINGAINIPLVDIKRKIEKYNNISKQSKILLYCKSGIRSSPYV